MVFQNYALYPHMTVAENMGFALKIAGVSKEERAERVLEAAKLLDLEPYLSRKPKALSGGQRQRVAIARALCGEPSILLADEPTGSLDAQTGESIMDLMLSMNQARGTTLILVTHDQKLAQRCNRTLTLQAGQLISQG